MPVAGPPFDGADVLLELVPHDGAVGQPVRQPRAEQRVGAEQAEFAAEPAVVVHGGLLTDGEAADHKTKPGAAAPG